MTEEMEDVRAEAKQRWEAAQAEERRKAIEASLFELDHKPEVVPPQPKPASASNANTSSGFKEQSPQQLQAMQSGQDGDSTQQVPSPHRQQELQREQQWQQQQQQPRLLEDDPLREPLGAQQSSSSAAVDIPPAWNAQTPTHGGPGGRPLSADGLMLDDGIPVMPQCGEQLFALAGMSPPSEASFDRFFRTWFDKEHFPTMSDGVQRELQHRARSRGFFPGMAAQIKGWAMKNTDERLQADVWCAYILQNSPPRFQAFGFVQCATVNLGCSVAPCEVTFYGYPHNGDQWVLPPWTSIEVDCSALLDELDTHGGMAALLTAAA